MRTYISCITILRTSTGKIQKQVGWTTWPKRMRLDPWMIQSFTGYHEVYHKVIYNIYISYIINKKSSFLLTITVTDHSSFSFSFIQYEPTNTAGIARCWGKKPKSWIRSPSRSSRQMMSPPQMGSAVFFYQRESLKMNKEYKKRTTTCR